MARMALVGGTHGYLLDRISMSKKSRRLRTRRTQKNRPLDLDYLEKRVVPTTLTVTTASDAVVHTGMSLRDAIATANANAGSGTADTIDFASNLSGATITLAQGQLELSGAGGITTTIDASTLASPVVISANKLGRVFLIDANVHAAFAGLNIANGQLHDDIGAGIENNGNLTLTSDAIQNNAVNQSDSSGRDGAGIYSTGTLTIDDCTIANNSALTEGDGGGLLNTGMATISNTTISGNSSVLGGGIWNQGAMTLSGVTVSGNGSSSGEGGGIFNFYLGGTLSVVNCTLTDNSSGIGGAIYNQALAPVTVTQSTIANNTAVTPSQSGTISGGGGIYGGVTLINSIVAGNTAPSFPDISGTATGNNNVVGAYDSTNGIQNGVNGNQAGTSANLLFAFLGPLQDNGGSTQTQAPQSNSVALGAGGAITTLARDASPTDTTIYVTDASAIAVTPGQYFIMIDGEEMEVTDVNISSNTLTVVRGLNGTTAAPLDGDPVFVYQDQRGILRAVPPDVGAYEANTTLPAAPSISSVSPSSGPVWGGTTVTIKGSNLGYSNLETIHFGASTATIVSDDGSTLVVTLPGGAPGNAPIELDCAGGIATSSTPFTYVAAPTLMVTTASDAVTHTGLSLRDAIAEADDQASFGSPTTILFAPALSGTTIALTQGQLELSGSSTITIDASGVSSPVAINANGTGRVLLIDSGVQAVIKGLTIEGGQLSDGEGAGLSNEGSLAVEACTIQNNATAGVGNGVGGDGGGIFSSGMLTVDDSTITGNSAAHGGGILASGTVALDDCTISNNNASALGNDTGRGGGLNVTGNTTITDCTISGNGAANGGGIYGGAVVNDSTITKNSVGGTLNFLDRGVGIGGGIAGGGTFTDCTISYNTANEGGGAQGGTFINCTIYGNSSGVDPEIIPGLGGGGISGGGVLVNCTVTANSSSNGGGLNGTFTLVNTIVADNSLSSSDGGSGPDLYGTLSLNSANNLIGVEPSLGSLVNNGGPTDTMALAPGSPAIGHGGAVTVVDSGVSSTSTSFTVMDGATLGVGNFPIWIGSEELFITGVSGNTITVIRGYEGSAATAHDSGTSIYLATDERGAPSDNPPDIGAFQTQTGSEPPSSHPSGNTARSIPPLVTATALETTTSKKHLVIGMLVTFSGALNGGEANNVANYHLIMSGKKGVFSSRHSTLIKLSSAYYDSATSSVLLLARKGFSLSKPVELVINGQPPSGLQDSYGRYIDGARTGQTGSNVVSLISYGRVSLSVAVNNSSVRHRVVVPTARSDYLRLWSRRLFPLPHSSRARSFRDA